MQQSLRLAELIQERIDDFLDAQTKSLEPLGPDATDMLNSARAFLRGGKRFRAQAVALGFMAAKPLDFDLPLSNDAGRVIAAASALEMFHAAALIHDDVIDRAATRRNQPAAHAAFALLHRERGWRHSATHFGVSSAILLGDLLQTWADMLLQEAVNYSPPALGRRARAHFDRMRTEVALGQYLDVVEEQLPQFAATSEQLDRASRVLLYKSAKYSVEEPLLIGAALAGASAELERVLSGYGVPVGVAFQLRDDLMGVFGDSQITGKPAGDDLREGKRTVLVTLARDELSGSIRNIFDEIFGAAELSAEQLLMLQRTIADTSARSQVEAMIQKNVALAVKFARNPEVAAAAVEPLIALAEKMAHRSF